MQERRTGSFHHSLPLPDTVNTDQAHPYLGAWGADHHCT
jgi:hypothetical protein